MVAPTETARSLVPEVGSSEAARILGAAPMLGAEHDLQQHHAAEPKCRDC